MPPPEPQRLQAPAKSKSSFVTTDIRQAADDRWAAFIRSSGVAAAWMIELLLAQALVHWQGDGMIYVLATAIGLVMGIGSALRACWDGFEALSMEQAIRKTESR